MIKLAFRIGILIAMAGTGFTSLAQTVLPDVKVTAPKWVERRGGYLISNNFQVDTHMSAVIYPDEPFEQDDIVAVKTLQMKRDEYFVLQECVSTDCTQGHILRVWNKFGALGITAHQLDRVSIPHEGKFFFWMQRFPMAGFNTPPFSSYEDFSPPMVLNPIGTEEQNRATNIEEAQQKGPVKVVSSEKSGSTFSIHFEGGTSIQIERMHAAE